MSQFLPANAEAAGSFSFDLKPTLADDAWAVLLTRVGIAIILVTQPLFIISELRLEGTGCDPWLLIGFHLFNFMAALVGLSVSWKARFREHWRAAAFTLCAMIVLSSTVMSVVVRGREEAFFVSLLLITGTLITFVTSLERMRATWLTLLEFSVSSSNGAFVEGTYSKSPQTNWPMTGAVTIVFRSYPSRGAIAFS